MYGRLCEIAGGRHRRRYTEESGDVRCCCPKVYVGSARLRFEDEGAKLDLNQIINNQEQRTALEKLFRELDLDPVLLDGVEAWIGDPNGARSYCALSPCEPRGGKLTSLDELRLIRGFDDSVIAKLAPYVTTHGEKGVNYNTADPLVLRAIGCADVGPDFRPPDGCKFEQMPDQCKPAKPQPIKQSKFFTIHATGEARHEHAHGDGPDEIRQDDQDDGLDQLGVHVPLTIARRSAPGCPLLPSPPR